MANLASALKEEIGRIARKEVRQHTAGTNRSTAQLEREVAALKRQVQALQSRLSSSSAPNSSGRTASKKTTTTKTAAKKQTAHGGAAASARAEKSSRARFSAKGLKANRERLGLSADSYGKLIGVSGLSIYNWEQGKARPRESSIAALMSIRGIGKREAAKRLGTTAKNTTRASAKAPEKAKTRTKKVGAKKASKDASADGATSAS